MLMLYFSGTGNSKYIAELFSRRMDAACHSIEESANFANMIDSSDTIAFCYPLYGSRVPRVMREFAVKHITSLASKKLIIFCTQMAFSGDGARAFVDLFPQGHVEVIYAEHFLMPNNVNNLWITPLANERTIKWYLSKAERKMQIVCDEIVRGVKKKRGFNPASRALGLIQGSMFPAMEKKALGKVWVDDDCTGCGLCLSVCPMNNFTDDNGKIVANGNCMICYRCINQCPEKAIAVFLKGKVKRQYKGV